MQTIKSSTEISQLFSTGHRLHTPYFTVIVGVQDDKQSNYERHGHSGRVAFYCGEEVGECRLEKPRQAPLASTLHGNGWAVGRL